MRRKSALAALFCGVVLTACGGSNADKVDDNLKKEAEKFNMLRKLVVTNNITDEVQYTAEGRCSFERPDSGRIDFICKEFAGEGPSAYRKYVFTVGDNVTVAVLQLKPLNVSEYRTKIIFRPESIIPDLDLVTGT